MISFDHPHRERLARAERRLAKFPSRRNPEQSFNGKTLARLFVIAAATILATDVGIQVGWPYIKSAFYSLEDKTMRALPAPPNGEFFNKPHNSSLKL